MSKLSLNDKMKRIRPFVTFNHDLRTNLDQTLTPSEKARITKYYNQLSKAVGRRNVVYRPRNPANIKKAAQAAGVTGSLFKAYPLPSPTGSGKVKWKGNQYVIEKGAAFVRTIYPDPRRLASEPGPYLEELLDDTKLYIINSSENGSGDWSVSGPKNQVINALQDSMWRYGWAENVYNDFWEDEEIEGAEYAEDEREEFPITIIECSFKKQQFKDYKAARERAFKGARQAEGRRKVRERSRKRRGKRSYGRKGKGK